MLQTFITKSTRWMLGLVCLTLSGLALAQANANQPITLIIPYPPGGSADMLARPMLPDLQKALGQTIVLDYKGGAGGTIATSALARAKPDGQTIILIRFIQSYLTTRVKILRLFHWWQPCLSWSPRH